LGVLLGEFTSNGLNLGTGLILLAVGYVAGRIIHGVTGLYDEWLLDLSERLSYTVQFETRLDSTTPNEVSESAVRSEITELVRDSLTKSSSVFSEIELDEPGYTEVRHLAESLLYADENIPWKYSVLSTFFRNISPILLATYLAVLLTTIQNTTQDLIDIIISLTPVVLGLGIAVILVLYLSRDIYLPWILLSGLALIGGLILENILLGGSLLFGFGVNIYQHIKFKRRETRAMVNELYLILRDDNDSLFGDVPISEE